MNPIVTVIVPCYNQGRYLSEALRTLQSQSLQEWECVVVDDGSTDDSAEIMNRLAADETRMRLVRQENAGPSAARNRGIKEARGRYVQFLDADDLLEPEKLRVHVGELEHNPTDSIVYGDVRYFTDERPKDFFYGVWGEREPWVGRPAVPGEPMLEAVLARNIMATCCPVFRRSALERVGPFDEEIRGCEDWEYWIRCVLRGEQFRYVDPPQTMALVRSHSQSTSRDVGRMLEGEIRFRLKLGKLLEGNARLRLQNFERGANRLRDLKPPDYSSRLLQLAKANATNRVLVYTLLRLIDRKNWLRSGARALRAAVFQGHSTGELRNARP